MSTYRMLLIFLGLQFLLVSCAARQDSAPPEQGRFTQHYGDTSFQVTENRQFSVELLPDRGSLTTGENTVQVIVHNKQDLDVEGAQVAATLFKVGEGEATQRQLTASERGAGIYIFEPEIDSPGHWRMRVSVAKGGVQDTAGFDFPNVRPASETPMQTKESASAAGGHTHTHADGHGHAHGTEMEKQERDTSTRTMSGKELFTVSYEPQSQPVPVGRIHSWKVTVKDAQGNPVEKARILVSGEMPDHGHGLPTEPQVTDYLGDGTFLVEGMKFNMPGWWVVRVDIFTMDDHDVAQFNLML